MNGISSVSPLRAVRGLLASGAIAASLLVTSAVSASAQIQFVGTTSYAFGADPLAATASYLGLSVAENTVARTGFDVTTSPLFPGVSFASIGGLGNNLGLVSLMGTPASNYFNTFSMNVLFSSPTIGSAQLFSATILGSVTANQTGGVLIRFNPAQLTGTYTNGPGAGTFTLSVNNLSVNAGQSNAQLTGDITATEVDASPEPASLVLLGTGLVGIVGFVRRRNK